MYMDAERREQELIARFRLRMARVASTIALIVIAALGLYVVLQPVHHVPVPREVFWALLAIAAIVSIAIHRRTRSGAPPLPLWSFYVWTAAVLAFDSGVLYLAGDPASDIYLSYLLPVLFAAATLPTWGAALALAAAVGAYVAVVLSLDGQVAQPALVLRAATFAVAGSLGAYLAREQQREIAVRVEKERDLSRLLEQAISAQEGERTRIARELHDGPVQSLSTLSMQLGLIEETAADTERCRDRIGDARVAIRRTIGELRRMVQDLRPSALDDLGLVNALHDLTAARCDAAGVHLQWSVSGTCRRLSPPVETAVFRIVQEGVNNVVRHAHARNAKVAISFEDGHVCASVEDDGVGFDPQALRRSRDGRGLGLLGMHERTALLGGTLDIGSAMNAGTRLRTRIPVGAAPDG